ncbi:MAG: magnesium transporter MgtE [Nitrospirae bacterium CG_4_10_14_0_8_um_filter_41_23]|nr:magnesium transporter [Nitrospirota bacterium]PIQ93957.1 MAG: magnesium transporter MgtE [Nitrospirae bacterium CG11_big_fil_rev_8_21_14_0_20_41_14]PIV44241.1 MAG: magnesium transporter MgtE [Nitrospirae bacterium CG02_land_8_20_14_3_00_41_53]PIW86881.1 MAG: magnesium transporter MgtE [Nitrospirae bacterium CG_4_8_14_3_um_filter_41_47]PIY87427.1 MAG: magnesium transporter MgtE [Nitrospirae bacterium CG_4_10_14_0_8_um_filter_41_23]PJA79731.1 MAG: magnesium transporter MgtE [Nitrospirae bacte
MPFLGELFVSEILKKPVLDPKGEEIGRVKDLVIVKGEPLPRVSSLIIDKKKRLFNLPWNDLNIFNKRIISTKIYSEALKPYEFSEKDLMIVRDILDKQIVDANGAKVVRVNDVKLEGLDTEAVLIAVDIGMRGIMRRLGVERGGEDLMRLFKKRLPYNLISWNYIQPLEPKLTTISLTVPRQMVSELHPADLAEIISQVSHKEGATFFKGLDVETAAEALSELQPDVQAAIITGMETEKAADIIEEMPPDEAADVLSDLPMDKAKEILESIEKEEAEDIQELLSHEEDTAGGLMTNEFIAYLPDTTVKEAIQKFKKDAEEVETVYYIYVIDTDEKLIGVVSLKDLLLADLNAKLSDIMATKLKTISPEADEMEVAEIASKYNLLAIPVIDNEGFILGIVTIDDIIDRILPPAAKRKRRKV